MHRKYVARPKELSIFTKIYHSWQFYASKGIKFMPARVSLCAYKDYVKLKDLNSNYLNKIISENTNLEHYLQIN